MGGIDRRETAHHEHADSADLPRSGAFVRPAVTAGLAFMEAARSESVGVAELANWIRVNLVEPGYMPMPATVHEPEVGSVALTEAEAWAEAMDARAARIVTAARERVSKHLRGLVSQPVDDRFLTAAIFAGRVRRAQGEHGSAWRPSPRGKERLSDIVLALFTADVLAHREDYEAQLGVCEECGRMCFGPEEALRMQCPRGLCAV